MIVYVVYNPSISLKPLHIYTELKFQEAVKEIAKTEKSKIKRKYIILQSNTKKNNENFAALYSELKKLDIEIQDLKKLKPINYKKICFKKKQEYKKLLKTINIYKKEQEEEQRLLNILNNYTDFDYLEFSPYYFEKYDLEDIVIEVKDKEIKKIKK